MYSCHLFFLNIWGLFRTATNLHPRRNCWAEMEMLLTVESASWNVYCIHYHVAEGGYEHTKNLFVPARRVMQYAAALGPRILFSAIAKTNFVFREIDFVSLSEMPRMQNLNSDVCILTVAPAARSLSRWDDEHRDALLSFLFSLPQCDGLMKLSQGLAFKCLIFLSERLNRFRALHNIV